MAEFFGVAVLEDAYGRKTRKSYQIEEIDLAAAQAVLDTQAIALADISEAEILWLSLSDVTVYADSVTVGANIDEGATVQVRKADNQLATVKIPAPVNSIFNADSTLDLTNALVIAYFAQFLTGEIRVSDGELATQVVRGKLDK